MPTFKGLFLYNIYKNNQKSNEKIILNPLQENQRV